MLFSKLLQLHKFAVHNYRFLQASASAMQAFPQSENPKSKQGMLRQPRPAYSTIARSLSSDKRKRPHFAERNFPTMPAGRK
jgi:hypothetical protein